MQGLVSKVPKASGLSGFPGLRRLGYVGTMENQVERTIGSEMETEVTVCGV